VRIWYQTMADISRYPEYGDSLRRRAAGILRGDTELDVHGVAEGTYGDLPPVRVSIHPLAYHVLLDQVIGNAIRAEREGCQVIALGSYSEPHLRVIRSAVDIPVVSLAESTLLTAMTLGRRIGLVTVTKPVAWMIEHHIDAHGLRDRVLPVQVIEPEVSEDELNASFAAPGKLISAFRETARRAIDDYADVIIPAEGVLSQVLSDHDVTSIDGVSVMDCVAVTLAHAEMMGVLHAATGLIQGRRWEYPIVGDAIRTRLVEHAATTPLSSARLSP
jgi:allantoin racemase